MNGDYGFENIVNYIKTAEFMKFLRYIGMGNEFTQEDLDIAFKGGNEGYYVLTELLNYFDKMKVTENYSIFAPANKNLKEILEELTEHLINSKLPVTRPNTDIHENDGERQGPGWNTNQE